MEHRSNPVLDADWPDPDVLRLGAEYWLIASSFNRAPGLPVLRSRNLVDWEHVTNALPELVPAEHYAVPRRGSGVWAPAIREHAGTVYVVYPDPDHGIYVIEAPHPAGPWSTPHLLLAGRGLIDPCPLWDADGRAYLVHGWARSRSGVKNRISLLEVTPDLTAPLSTSQVIIDGAEIPGMLTLEGPKAYVTGGEYWIYAPAGGVADGYQVVFRASELRGPYEHRVVLEQGSTPVNGPHQGALVDDVDGRWWFIHFQDRDVFGRVTHVQPVRFDEDGWPHMGAPLDAVRGRPVAVVPELGVRPGGDASQRPELSADGDILPSPSPSAASEHTEPLRSDDFTSATLHPRWHWQANPRPEWSRTGEGGLDLAFAPSPRGDLRDLGAVLGQQLPGRPSHWAMDLHLPGAATAPGVGVERAGLVVLGLSYAWAGLRRDAHGISLVHATMGEEEADESLHTRELLSTDPATDTSVRLRLDVDAAGLITLGASPAHPRGVGAEGRSPGIVDGIGTNGPGGPMTLLAHWQSTKGRWIGAEVGLFATADSMVHHPLEDRRARFGPVTVRREGREA